MIKICYSIDTIFFKIWEKEEKPMKKFFMSCVVVVVALFLGFTTYYFVANKEHISLAQESSAIKLNVGDSLMFDDIIKHDLPNAGTVFGVDFSVEGVISYDASTKTFTATKVGSAVVTITPSNAKYGPFVLNATVGDGSSAEYPYYIRTAQELTSIGASGSNLTINMNYELIADIYLTNTTWTPLASGVDAGYTATFNGGNHIIYDMTVNSGNKAGFFAKVGANGVVKGIKFVNATLSGDFIYAGIVAAENQGTVSLCYVTDSNITNGNGATGGIVGYSVFSQYDNGALSARVGMCGVENTNITAGGDIGGIVGCNNGSIVENCYAALNSVNGSTTAYFGGIVGNNKGYSSTYTKASTIYKSHASAKLVADTKAAAGIVGRNTDASSSAKNVFVQNVFAMETNNFVGTTTSALSSEIVKVAVEDLKNPTTYQTWDFNSVWKMGENYADINFKMPYTTKISESIIFTETIYPDPKPSNPSQPSQPSTPSTPSTPITPGPTVVGETLTASNIFLALKEMHDNPNSGKIYTFTTSFTVNLATAPSGYTCADLFPLGTKEKPFTCQIYPSASQTITFTNLSVNGKDYASFFGYMGRGATVNGINITGANIVGSTSTNAAVFASNMLNGATLANCSVVTATVSGYNNVAIVVGNNSGTLISVEANSGILNTNGNVNAGVLVGLNSGSITSCTAINNTVNPSGQGSFGGVTGYNQGAVSACTVSSLFMNGSNVANIYAGAVAGQNNGTIYNTIVQDCDVEVSTSHATAKAAGVAAYNSTNGVISKASVYSTEVTGYYVGGLTAINSGSITKSTAGINHQGKLSGIYVGGLTSINQTGGKIDNCLVGTQLVTMQGSQKTCGFAYKLEANSNINNCFTYAIFSGNHGDKACDTDTPFRHFWANGIWQNTIGYEMGNITNSILCNISKVDIYGNGIIPPGLDGSIKDIQVTEAEAKGSDNWAKFYTNGFNFDSVWNRTNGQFLTLK